MYKRQQIEGFKIEKIHRVTKVTTAKIKLFILLLPVHTCDFYLTLD